MPTSADLLLDTSAAIALLHEQNPLHDSVSDTCRGRSLGLAGHAMVETYSVLTRLPGAARVTPRGAERLIAAAFPASSALPPREALRAVQTLSAAGIAGGAVYDGLVALAAKSAGVPLLTCDRRAVHTYAALGVDVVLA
ncbi:MULTISPECIES: PIN domain-containing protein [unclassified Microbacterium]|uniref:PIN domain-containing protein n=1 Tax=unclassified Microbacterium TaxID=2609290 RepID=UPI00343C5A82